MGIQFNHVISLNHNVNCYGSQQKSKHKLKKIRNVGVHTNGDIGLPQVFFLKNRTLETTAIVRRCSAKALL